MNAEETIHQNESVPRLAVIVPCFNEYLRMPMAEFDAFIPHHPELYFCFVNDGSTDQTLKHLDSLKSNYPDQVTVINAERNVGKAESVRAGILHICELINPPYVAYIDADLSAPLPELSRLYQEMITSEFLMIFGSRIAYYGTDIQRNLMRHYVGRIFATLASILLGLAIYDTQCGLKIFRSKLALDLFREPFSSRWLFDVELFARLKTLHQRSNLKQIMNEFPLMNWTEKGSSKIKISELLQLPWSFAKIGYRYRKRQQT